MGFVGKDSIDQTLSQKRYVRASKVNSEFFKIQVFEFCVQIYFYFNPGAAGCTQKCANGFSAGFSLSSDNLINFSSGLKSIIFHALFAQMLKIFTT